MRDHALICKFIGYWSMEKELYKWIYQRWKPKGHVDLKLGAKGFFQPSLRIWETKKGFLRKDHISWTMRVCSWNTRRRDITLKTRKWWRLHFGLDFLAYQWNSGILKYLRGSETRSVILFKIAEAIKRGKYTSYAWLCVYMNIEEPLPEYVELECHDEVWQQQIDYEHIPFMCWRFHEYGHLYRQFPLSKEEGLSKSQDKQEGETGK